MFWIYYTILTGKKIKLNGYLLWEKLREIKTVPLRGKANYCLEQIITILYYPIMFIHIHGVT